MPSSKKAASPSEGIYYVVPVKAGGVTVMSQREDEQEDATHMFYWPKVVSNLAHEYGFDRAEIEDLHTKYLALPRGRIQKEHDPETLQPTGRYLVLHGGDVPESTIRYAVHQDFGLIALAVEGKVVWRIEEHEKMDPDDRKDLLAIIKRHKEKV